MKFCNLLCTVMAILVSVPVASGQMFFDGVSDGNDPLSGTGIAALKRPANGMVALFSLKATGTNIREATAALRQVTEDAKAKIVELGAQEDSLRAAVIRLHRETEDANQRLMMQMGRSPGGRGSVPEESEDAAEAEEIVTVATTIRATWVLDSSSPDEALAS